MWSSTNHDFCYKTTIVSDKKKKLKIFAPKQMVARIMKDHRPGYMAYFDAQGQEKKAGRTYNK